MNFLKEITSEIKHIKERLNEISIQEAQARLEALEEKINVIYNQTKITPPEEFIEEKSLEELTSIIINGVRYSPVAIELFRHFYQHDENERDILCAAYKLLNDVDFRINENETEDEVENRRDKISSAMHQYAYNNSLEWSGSSFWEPSRC